KIAEDRIAGIDDGDVQEALSAIGKAASKLIELVVGEPCSESTPRPSSKLRRIDEIVTEVLDDLRPRVERQSEPALVERDTECGPNRARPSSEPKPRSRPLTASIPAVSRSC